MKYRLIYHLKDNVQGFFHKDFKEKSELIGFIANLDFNKYEVLKIFKYKDEASENE